MPSSSGLSRSWHGAVPPGTCLISLYYSIQQKDATPLGTPGRRAISFRNAADACLCSARYRATRNAPAQGNRTTILRQAATQRAAWWPLSFLASSASSRCSLPLLPLPVGRRREGRRWHGSCKRCLYLHGLEASTRRSRPQGCAFRQHTYRLNRSVEGWTGFPAPHPIAHSNVAVPHTHCPFTFTTHTAPHFTTFAFTHYTHTCPFTLHTCHHTEAKRSAHTTELLRALAGPGTTPHLPALTPQAEGDALHPHPPQPHRTSQA